jgi:hypothetical protein
MIELGERVVRRFKKSSTGIRHFDDPSISSKEQKPKLVLVFSNGPAEIGLRDVKHSCRPAKVQLARDG